MPRLLDLFCGAGGAAVGYHRAGFEVVGVDIKPQPNYPFSFVQSDAFEFMADLDSYSRTDYNAGSFAAIHASPPCQYYSNLKRRQTHWRSIPPTRVLLQESGLPYVIENISDAKWDMLSPVQLCGSAFGLGVRRHRLFETSFPLMVPPCTWQEEIRAYYGKKGWLVWTRGGAQVQSKDRKPLLRGSVEQAPEDMGIDWMKTWDELREAIPPAYTEFIGRALLEHIGRESQTEGGKVGSTP